MRWNELSMKDRADVMKLFIDRGIYDLDTIKGEYNRFAEGGDTVEEWIDAIYQNNPKEEFLGEPKHHYDFTQSEEWANAHGYYPDARGHRDDRVKKPAHPSHPSRGTWDGDKFILTDTGMENPNYTLFGLNDGGQDPQAILTYQGGSVIPEITVTPNSNYIYNPYDNIKLKFAEGGGIHIDPSKRGTFTAAASRHNMGVQEFASKVLANKDDYSAAMVKKANFARNASKWHAYGGNLFEIGGDKDSYDAPQTFAGRVAQVVGAYPRTVRGADVASSVLQMTPYGYTTAALDLGRDINRAYHREEGAWKDAGLDILGMIPGVSKLGMKKIKPKTWIDKMKQGYDELLQPARKGINSAINVLKALDFTDDTWGANKTSDAKQTRRSKH